MTHRFLPSSILSFEAPRLRRKGQQIGLTLRNYKRHLGTLLGTYWDLQEIELGVLDRSYDTITGEYYFEKKIIKMKVGGLIDVQWIKERKPEKEFEAEAQEEEKRSQELVTPLDRTSEGQP